ncbi:MAG: sigma-70 family RNA polymerase sigma factor [Gemmatimonadota bacterium]
MDDEQLIRRAREGDQDAFRSLYDRHVDRVFRLTHRVTGDEQLARECTQDTFVRAFGRLGEFRGEARFSTWLHSIAVSVSINGARKVKRLHTRQADLDPEVQGRPTRAADPGLRERLAQAIDALPEIYRTVFLMHDLEGYPHNDIAEALGIALGTSKARLSRARAALRGLLGDAVKEYVT